MNCALNFFLKITKSETSITKNNENHFSTSYAYSIGVGKRRIILQYERFKVGNSSNGYIYCILGHEVWLQMCITTEVSWL